MLVMQKGLKQILLDYSRCWINILHKEINITR